MVELVQETASTKSLVLDLPGWQGHRAGQHVDVRLTAEDGYQAQRSYSIASAPEDEELALTVERLDDGEVSPYLVDVVRAGDELELRGPIGGYFVWEVSLGGPVLLVGGGSGVVPLRAILRHHRASGSDVGMTLLYSVRGPDEVIYRKELEGLVSPDVTVELTYTRSAPEGWKGNRRRVDRELLAEVAPPPEARPLVYVCGPTGFVEAVAGSLVELGHDPARVRTERFGASGS